MGGQEEGGKDIDLNNAHWWREEGEELRWFGEEEEGEGELWLE